MRHESVVQAALSLTPLDTAGRVIAHRRVSVATPAECAKWLRDNVGQRVTAAAVGIRNPNLITAVAEGDAILTPREETALRELFEASLIITAQHDDVTLRAWLAGRYDRELR